MSKKAKLSGEANFPEFVYIRRYVNDRRMTEASWKLESLVTTHPSGPSEIATYRLQSFNSYLPDDDIFLGYVGGLSRRRAKKRKASKKARKKSVRG